MARETASAREQARKLHQQEERKRKQQSLLLRIGVVVFTLVVVAALSIWVITRGAGGSYTEGPAPAAANEQGGFVLTSSTELAEGDALGEVDAEDISGAETTDEDGLPPGVSAREEGEVPHVVIYTDAGCPSCGQFESAYHVLMTDWAEAGAITLEYRSLTFISPPYSAQTANAFACIAEESPENYLSYLGAVTSVRADGSELSNDQLAETAQQNYDVDISACVDEGTYRAFGQYTTALAQENGITGTPTIFVDDQQVEEFMGTGDLILEAVAAYEEETGEELLPEGEAEVEDIEEQADGDAEPSEAEED